MVTVSLGFSLSGCPWPTSTSLNAPVSVDVQNCWTTRFLTALFLQSRQGLCDCVFALGGLFSVREEPGPELGLCAWLHPPLLPASRSVPPVGVPAWEGLGPPRSSDGWELWARAAFVPGTWGHPAVSQPQRGCQRLQRGVPKREGPGKSAIKVKLLTQIPKYVWGGIETINAKQGQPVPQTCLITHNQNNVWTDHLLYFGSSWGLIDRWFAWRFYSCTTACNAPGIITIIMNEFSRNLERWCE